MRLYKRRPDGVGPWWFGFSHRGKAVRRSSGTEDKEAAQEYADRYRAALWRADRLDERPPVAWNIAVGDWLAANQHLRAISDRKDHLRWADKHLNGKLLSTITVAVLTKMRSKKVAEGATASTANRYMASVSAVLGHAVVKQWINSRPRLKKLPEPAKRVRWATQEQAAKLIGALPAHLAAMVAFSLTTGLRRFNVTHLEWGAVDLRRRIAWVHADETKGGRTIPVPLSNEAVALLRAQRGKHEVYVFPYKGRAMTRPYCYLWNAACKKAGLKKFRWHDLRHTWASWHVQNGTPLPVLQELGGWRSLAMVQRYSHLGPSHLAAFAGNARIAGNVQKQAHGPNGKGMKRAA